VQGPVISFTFDDVPRSAVSAGGEILKQHGLQGTYYVCMGLERITNELGEHFHADDLRWLVEHGHEIGCHTYGHHSLKARAVEEIAADLTRNRNALQEVLPGFTPRQFSFPYGHVSVAALRLVREKFESCRGIAAGINAPRVRLDLLRANRLYETIPVERNLKLIDEVLEKRGWLIFYTHDVAGAPSTFGCSPSYFEAIVSKAAASGAEVLKVGEAVARVRNLQAAN